MNVFCCILPEPSLVTFTRQLANQLDSSYGTTQKVQHDVITPGATGAPSSSQNKPATEQDRVFATFPVDDVINGDGSSSLSEVNDDPDDAPGDAPENHTQLVAVVIGAGAALFLLLLAIVVICFCRARKRGGKMAEVNAVMRQHDQNVTLNLDQLKQMTAKASNTSLSNNQSQPDDFESQRLLFANGVVGGYHDEFDVIQARRLPELPALAMPESGTGTTVSSHCKTPTLAWTPSSSPTLTVVLDSSSDTNASRDYAVPDFSRNTTFAPITSGTSTFVPNIPTKHSFPPAPDTIFATFDRRAPAGESLHPRGVYSRAGSVPSLQGFSGASHYGVPSNIELLWKNDRVQLIEFPRTSLRMLEKLGEGQFGEVHLCEASDVADVIGDDLLTNRTGSDSMKVAVKILQPNASEQARSVC